MCNRIFVSTNVIAQAKHATRGILFFAAAALLGGSLARGAGVVSTCDESHLRAALAGGGAVTFSCTGDITLAAALTITKNTSIDGSGQRVTIDGLHKVGVFTVYSGVTLNLNELTIANGAPSNKSGGGIANFGTLIVTSSTFSRNYGVSGGGIFNYFGTITVTNSTFFANSALNHEGGGIYNDNGIATVNNSTFYGNSAPRGMGGAIVNGGTLSVTSSTLWENSSPQGGGIFSFSGKEPTLANTILANNKGGACGGASITDGGYNLDDDGTCGLSSTNHSLSDNKNADLGSFSHNGGPTETVPLEPGSAAIGVIPAGTNSCATTIAIDQRGITRPASVNGNCSIGAYEFVPPATSTVSDCSSDSQLQAAVQAGGRIVLTCGVELTDALNITSDTSIEGANQHTGFYRNHNVTDILIGVGPGSTLTLKGLSISGGGSNDYNGYIVGGGIFSSGTLIVINSEVTDNWGVSGGSIYVGYGTAIITNSTVSGGAFEGQGGDIYNGGALTVTNSTFPSGYALDGGGGIYNGYGATATVINSTFYDVATILNDSGGNVTLENTILVFGHPDCSGAITDGGYNLDDDGTCGFTSAHSFSNNPNADLGSLDNYGGPTETIPLLPGSIAIDQIPLGANGCGTILTDQRGVFRPQGPACDIGAFEVIQ